LTDFVIALLLPENARPRIDRAGIEHSETAMFVLTARMRGRHRRNGAGERQAAVGLVSRNTFSRY